MAAPSAGILYAAVQGKHSVAASRGGSRSDVADLASKLLSQVDLKVETKKSYASKGYVSRRHVLSLLLSLADATSTES
jgi:hypothetical protein